MNDANTTHNDLEDAIREEQVRLAMRQLATMQAASFIVALVLCFIVRNQVPLPYILAWLTLILAVVASRVQLHRRFSRIRDRSFSGKQWTNVYLALAIFSGIVWGLSAFMVYPSDNMALMPFFVLVMASLAAATTVSHSSVKLAPAAWAVPAMLFYAARCVMEGGQIGLTIAFLIVVYLFTIVRYSFTHNSVITSAIALKFENLKLLEEVQTVNQMLRRDITERKRAEVERLEMERRLLHAQKLESLGVMAGGIAHDFNNLLMAIMGNLDLTLLDLPSDCRARTCVEQAYKASRRAGELTSQMLAYSGKGHLRPSPMDLSDEVRKNAQLFRAAIARTITLEVALSSRPATVEADPGQIQQVVMNLITNASEAIGQNPGGIAITTGTMDCDDECLSRSCLDEKPPPGRFAYIEVSDTGCGMDEKTRQRLFDPFFTTKFTGRGLGMSAVMGIVRGHRGAILVESEVGWGTTVRVLFPACEPPVSTAPELPAAAAEEPPMMGSVLVVDDEHGIREPCMAHVERLGFHAVGAADGEEALRLFQENAKEFVCVLLDLTMPRMSGLTAYQELKRIRPDVPVILCSGYGEEDATNRFAGQKLAGFLHKPYTLEELKQSLTRALNTAA